MNNKLDRPVLLTVREVTKLLRIQRPKVYELIKAGAIEGFKVGADWRIRRDSVENLIGAIPDNFFKNRRPENELQEEEQQQQNPNPSILR
jgi:excisionase family DNA binding protein